MDLSAAWRLSRVIKRLMPDVIHAHDPHGVAMASLALSLGASSRTSGGSSGTGRAPALVAARRVDFHLKGNSFSRWKYRQVDCFIAASETIRQMLGPTACRWAHGHRTGASTSITARRRP
jgi:hypothetical protein